MSREHNVIIKPLITEKATKSRLKNNIYYFSVDINATKPEVKKAVERLFNVKVESVNISNRKGKVKRMRYKAGLTETTKIAIIKLKSGNSIKFFEGK